MIPAHLNHYRILGPIGQGGMGEVYAAEDTRLHRKVAIKVLPKLMAGDPERRQRFEREAQAVAALNHPNIVTIHSVEEAGGLAFLVMELIEGRPLTDLMSNGAMPLDSLLRVGIEVSGAIGEAHQRGITHRDLKPANVMVTGDGRVKVLDFGLAKLREAESAEDGTTRMPASDLTGEGRIIGTVAYMSPEQAEGKPVDQRSDIFSLGVMLHEMATGDRPFKGDTNVSVISSILKDTPPSITDLNPALPAGLSKIVRRSLTKDPSRRYQTATDLRNELEELKQEIDSGITLSMSAPRPSHGPPPARGKTAIVAAAVLAVALAGAAWYLATRPKAATVFEADRFTRLTTGGNATLAAASADGRYVVHIKNDGLNPSLWVRQTATSSDVQIVPAAPVRYDGLSYSPDGDYVYYVTYELAGGVGTLYKIPVLGGAPQQVLEDIDSRISFSPDRRQFAFIRGFPTVGRNFVMVANADGSGARQVASLESPDQFQLNAPSWSPDGATVLASARSLRDGPSNMVFAVDVVAGTSRNVGGKWGFVGDLEWMPDGRSFVMSGVDFTASTPQLWQITFPTGQRRRITNDLNTYIGVSLGADGKSITTIQTETNANLWILTTGESAEARQVTSGRGRADALQGLSWTGDGRLVFSSAPSGLPGIWIVNADGTGQRQLTHDPAPAIGPAATRDGRFVVYQQFRENGMYLWRMGTDGGNPKQLTNGGAEFQPIVSADSRTVYFFSPVSGQARAYKVSIDGGEQSPVGHVPFRPVSVSSDGKMLLGVSWDEERRRSAMALMSTDGGEPRLLRDVPVLGPVPSWAPDGGVTYVDVRDGRFNVWVRPLEGGGARQITHFHMGLQRQLTEKERLQRQLTETDVTLLASENIYSFAWSPDGRQLALSRGQAGSDVVMITMKQRGPE